ncbi:MAG: LuxR C-terminal-related transcriptional regulator [Anaerolineales bacterium]|jgi:LuxR family maltose regulon positive regulatory protein|nr:LuxR C-terminal-related transcriptional regulator [Anaerolineales bacterium]
MPISPLFAKIQLPAVRSGLVLRPRLLQKLNAGFDGKLTLVSASTGFGKTTLVSEWLRQCGRPVAWLALDELDNDPLRFFAYLVRAIQEIKAGFGAALLENLKASRTIPPGMLEALTSEIAEIQAAFLLALDDYHAITNHVIQEMLQFVVNNQPGNLHLVIISRTDPPWPLGRLRARREVNEIRAADLRFTPEETAEFLNERMRLSLTPEQVSALESRTEGWIAGLQLAALSLQGQANPQAIIASLAGSHRFIADYLIEEVLEKQVSETQEFLLKTSILSQMNAALCDHLTGRSDSQAILLQLEQANLFLQALDGERQWFRYHHLFADLLRARLTQTRRTELPALHRAASQWCEGQGLVSEAVGHALAAQDFERVTRLVAGNAFLLLDTGELTTLLGWLDALPRPLLMAQPWLSVFYAWALAYTGQLDQVETHLRHAENTLAAESKPDSDQVQLQGHIAAIRTLLAKNSGHMSHAVELADQALRCLPEDDQKTRSFVAAMLGNALLWGNQLDEAAAAFQMAVQAAQQAGETHMAVHALCDLAGMHILRGQLRSAEAACQRALRLAASRGVRPIPGADFAHARLAGVLLHRNELESARRHAELGLELSKRRGQADITFFCLLTLAEVRRCLEDAPGAQAALQQARQIESGADWHTAVIAQSEASLALSQGSLLPAETWLAKLGWQPGDLIPTGRDTAFLLVTQILLARREYRAALDIIAQLLDRSRVSGSLTIELLLLVLQAQAYHGMGKTDSALSALQRALELAEPEGYVRIFVDKTTPLQNLLTQAKVRGIRRTYVQRLLAAYELPEAPLLQTIENFSERELEVLHLLATGLESAEIAEKLVISANTARTHIKHLYRKLNAHSRYEAILQARTLKLLP